MGDPIKPLVICEPDERWPSQFATAAARLREILPAAEVVRIDHIGSTSVPGLPAKDVIDVQVTVPELAVADGWLDELAPGLVRRPSVLDDHVPPLADDDPAQWAKRYWAQSQTLHVHVRAEGRPNQRYALLFRDYLRADRVAAQAYGRLKRALAAQAPDDWDTYYAVKDPACDLIAAGAEQWAARTDWRPGPSDA